MIRLKIEAIKAPWPQGAAVGDVVELDAQSVEADPVAEAEAQATEERAAIDAKAALVEKAKALGLDIDGRWSEKRLAQEVAKAEAKA